MGADGEQSTAAVEGGGGEGAATLHIRCSNGSKFTVQTGLDATVGAFKAVVAVSCDVPAEQQRLIYKGRILKDEQTLASYGMESDHTIHLVRGVAPSSAPTNTTSTNLGDSRGTSGDTLGVSTGIGSNEGGAFGGAGLGGVLFPGLGAPGLGANGASGLFGTGFPEFDQVQQQLTQNPNMMREIMNMPIIQNLMNNPEIMRNLIMSNPQMRELMDRNPELAHVLNDPSTLRQTLEAARNPELMREVMRNTDRAMSNIESSPEGFNMLRRMYETVQEPFLNATTMAGETGSDAASNPFAALLGNQGPRQSTNQPPNPSSVNGETTAGSSAPNTDPLPNPWSSTAGGTQPAITRSTPSNARTANMAGLGAMPELERMAGGMMDPSIMNQILQNPLTGQLMQSLLSNPQNVNELFGSNPHMRSLLDSNPQVREMLQNPEFIRLLTSPEMMQQMMSLHQTVFSQLNRQPSGQGQNQTPGATGATNPAGLESLMNLFGVLGGAGVGGAAATPDVPPEELYATQLSQLQEMGFFDTQENIRALSATRGNVHAAVDLLLGNFGQ